MVCLLVGLGIVGLAFSITAQYFAAKAAVGFSSKVKHELFRHIESLSWSEIDQVGTSTLITRMTSDMNQIQNGVNLTLRLLLRSPFVVFRQPMSWRLLSTFRRRLYSLRLYRCFPLLSSESCCGAFRFTRRFRQGSTKCSELRVRTSPGVRVVRAFCKEDQEIDTFNKSNDELTAGPEVRPEEYPR